MSIARKIGNLGTALDSAALSTFLSKGTTDGEFDTIAWGDVTGKPSYIDSSLATQLFDSAYVQLRQSAVSSGGLDSAAVVSLIDSNYVAARATAASSSGFVMYNYNATSGQTAFQDSDTAGNVLSYTADGILVYYNGLLLADEDYTATDGSAVTLTDGADSGAQITIGKWNLTGSGSSGSSAVWYGDRGLISGGNSAGNTIDYITIASPGNATDFGDLLMSRNYCAALGDGTYGVITGGSGTPAQTTMDYVTVATTANASDFGDMTTNKNYHASVCDGTYGVNAGGAVNPGRDVIEYFTVATPSNASDFGDINNDTSWGFVGGGLANATYGVFAGGSNYTYSNTYIDYITIDTPGNATDFGNLTAARAYIGGVSDETRGVFPGDNNNNVIDYITIDTPGNATDFGDMNWQDQATAGMSDATYGVWAAGGNIDQQMDYITIQTTSNATDFGDLTEGRVQSGGCSGSSS